jgi:hypothetical protein
VNSNACNTHIKHYVPHKYVTNDDDDDDNNNNNNNNNNEVNI